MQQVKMQETDGPAPPAAIPAAVVFPRRRAPLPLVWLVPLVAAVIGGWIAVRAVLDRGPIIMIQFQTAEGLDQGKTRIRYRNVDVGQVSAIALARDHRTVWVTAEMAKDADSFLAED